MRIAPRKQEIHHGFPKMHHDFGRCTRLYRKMHHENEKCTKLFLKCTRANRKMQPTSLILSKYVVVSHNSTLILIESGYCYFYQKPQYFWAFQRFKADLGSSRERPFYVYGFFSRLRQNLGSLNFS